MSRPRLVATTAEPSLAERLRDAWWRCVAASDAARDAQARYRQAQAEYDRLVAEDQRRRMMPCPGPAR